MSEERATCEIVGQVCVVTEIDSRTGRSSLYGVFTDEGSARHDYGDESEPYRVRFDVVSLSTVWPRPDVGSVARVGASDRAAGEQ